MVETKLLHMADPQVGFTKFGHCRRGRFVHSRCVGDLGSCCIHFLFKTNNNKDVVMPIPVLDDVAMSARVDEIDQELATNADADREALEKERQSLEDQIMARGEYDQNEANGMSSTDATVEAGRPTTPIDKLQDKIANSGSQQEQGGGDQQHQEDQQQGQEQQQSKPEPEPETGTETEPDTEHTGIRTVPVVEVTVTPGPHASGNSGGVSTNQPRPEAMRSLGRQHYDSRYVNTPSIWQYPDASQNTDQVGLVRQSYKSFFGMN